MWAVLISAAKVIMCMERILPTIYTWLTIACPSMSWPPCSRTLALWKEEIKSKEDI